MTAKKTSFRLPDRADKPATQLDEWVQGRAAESPPPAPPPPAEAAVTAKPARLTIDLPPDLHARFKATCALRGVRMVDEVRQFIEEWTRKNT